jgi:hypothetical protein
VLQQIENRDAEAVGKAFDRTQSEITFPAFEPAHIGPVHAQRLSERFLAQSAILTDSPEMLPDHSLQIAFHEKEFATPLLVSLQTEK